MEGARAATAEDLERLVDLARQAIVELRDQRGGELWARTAARREPLSAGFEAALADPDHHVLVGTYEGAALGYGAVRADDLPDGTRLGVVTDLYVEPAARGVGIGEALMDELVRWCADQGCGGVDSLALPGDRATKNFFESFGLVTRALVVHKELDR